MPGWKVFAPIIATPCRAPPEREGIMKKMNKRKKKNRAIPGVFFGYEIFMVTFRNSKKIARFVYVSTQSVCHVEIPVDYSYIAVL